MADLQRQLTDFGNALQALRDLPDSSDVLFVVLEDLEHLLTGVGQQPTASMRDALQPLMEALIAPELLRNLDMDVKIAVATCISELTRITAPNPPYEDEVMKEYFELAVLALGRLYLTDDRCYSKAVSILSTLGKVRSCVLMLDLEMDVLVLQMFQQLLSTIQFNPSRFLFPHMVDVMAVLIDESDGDPKDLLDILLISLKKENKAISLFSSLLGGRVLKKCATKIRPHLAKAVRRMGTDFNDYAGIVASIYQDATQGENMAIKEPISNATCPTEVGQLLVGPYNSTENNFTAQDVDHDISKTQKGDQMYQSLIIDNATDNHSFPDESHCRKGALKKKGYLVAKNRSEQKEVSFSAEMVHKNQNRGKTTLPENSDEELVIQALIEFKALASRLNHETLRSEVHLGMVPTSQDKRKSCSSMEEASSMTYLVKDSVENLIGHRIRVWWPMDQKFYEGYIASFDHSTKKHKVIYDDGDIEILNLNEECWQFIKDTIVSDGQDMLHVSSTSSDMLYSFGPSRKKLKALDAAGTEHVSTPNHKNVWVMRRRPSKKGMKVNMAKQAGRQAAVPKTSKIYCSTNSSEKQKMVGGADAGGPRVESNILKAAGPE